MPAGKAIMLQHLIPFFCLYSLALLLAYALGFGLLKLSKNLTINGVYTHTFVCLLLGITLLVVCYSLLRSHGLSINVFLPLVLAMVFYRRKIRLGQAGQIEGNFNFSWLHLPVILFSFAWFALVVMKPGALPFRAVEYDNALYSQLSEQLRQTGIENRWWMNFSDTTSITGPNPYHYFDGWLNALLVALSGVNPLAGFYLVTYPLFVTLALYGILALFEQFKRIDLLRVLLAVLLLLAGPVYLIKNHDHLFNTNGSEIPLQHYGEKLAVYYPFICFAMLLLFNGFSEAALLWLLSLCCVSFTVFPALLIAYLFLLPFTFKKHKSALIAAAFFFLAIVVFYRVFSSIHDLPGAGNWRSYTDLEILNAQHLRLFLSDLCIGFFKRLALFSADYFYALLMIAYVLAYLRSAVARQLLLLLLCCAGGLLAALIVYKMPDSAQLFTNTLVLVHALIIALFIILLHQAKHKFIANVFMIIVLFNSACNAWLSFKEYRTMQKNISVSDDYLLRVKSMADSCTVQPKAGFIYNQADLDQLLSKPYSNYLYHLAWAGINAVPVKLSCNEVDQFNGTPGEQQLLRMLNEQELFYNYKVARPNMTADSLMLTFIKQQQLRFILASPTAHIPAFLEQHATVITDAGTHLKFLRISGL